MGQVVATERKAHDDAMRELRIENARLLSRLLEVEARDRETQPIRDLPALPRQPTIRRVA